MHTQNHSYLFHNYFERLNIIADNIKLDYNKETIKKLLKNDMSLYRKKSKWITFTFENSKRYGWIKFADFIAWKLREHYINNKEMLDSDFIEYFVNDEISFIILEE